MSAAHHTPKFQMPSVYRPKNEKVFRCKVGYAHDKRGKRKRREFRLSADPLIAHKMALGLQEKWMKEEARHCRAVPQFAEVFGDESPLSLPVWTGMPEIDEAGPELYLSIPPETLPDDLEGEAPTSTPLEPARTLAFWVKDLLSRLRQKAEKGQKASRTYWWYEHELRLGFISPAIDLNWEPTHLTLPRIENYCAYWTDLKARAAESTKKRFGWRSACNRIDAFTYFLRDLEGRAPGFAIPPGTRRAIGEAKQVVDGDMTVIWQYEAALLRDVIAAGDDRHRLFIYLALNFGMYQCDIGQQLQRKHEPNWGGFTSIGGERYLPWWRYKLRRRRRQMMRNAKDGCQVPVLMTHYTWPETAALLDRFSADESNPHNKWLLNQKGLPLWRHPAQAKNKTDNVTCVYSRVLRTAKLSLPFEQIRKFGATAAESMGSRDIQEMYRGERRGGSSKAYVLHDYIAKLTPFLKSWAEQLRADRVLY